MSSVKKKSLRLEEKPRIRDFAKMIEMTLQTPQHAVFVDITHKIQKIVEREKWKEGVVTIYIPHTTAAVTIQENADPDVVSDMIRSLEKIVPWNDPDYRHGEGNAAAHLKASMLGTSSQCLLKAGHLCLGRWQGIYFCEFDGPRSRQVWLGFQGV